MYFSTSRQYRMAFLYQRSSMAMPGVLLRDPLVHELDDAADGPLRIRRSRVLLDESLGLALVHLELDLAACLPIGRHEPVQIGTRMRDVGRALQVQRGRHLHALPALERPRRRALRHRVLRPPELVVTRQHAVDDVGVRPAARLERLPILIAAE